MNQLVERSGVPRTTIHFYLRQGILPPPCKTARNAALYGREHLVKLEAIQRLRSGSDSVPLSVIRRVMELIDQGVEPAVAVVLQRSVFGDQVEMEGEGRFTPVELAEHCGAELRVVEELFRSGVLLAAPGPEPPLFDGLDLALAKRIVAVLEETNLEPSALGPVAENLREASQREMELRNRCVEGMAQPEAAGISALLQQFVNAWHPYLFFRARQHDIALHGLGVDAERVETETDERKTT